MERPSSTNLPCGGEATVRLPRSLGGQIQRLEPWAWGPSPALLRDCPGASALWAPTGQDGEWGPPSPPGAAGGRRAASLPRGCCGLAGAGKTGPLGGTAAAGGTSPAGTGGCQASESFLPMDWPWWQFLLWEEKIEVQVNLEITGEDLGLMVKRQAWVHASALPIPAMTLTK